MGLKRVLIGVIPLISLICLDGINFISSFSKNKNISRIVVFVLLALVIIFPFTKNHAAVHWKTEFSLTTEEKIIDEITTDIKAKYPNSVYYYYPRYIAIALNIDHFNKNIKKELHELFDGQAVPDNAVIIWDNYWAVVGDGIPLEKISDDKRFKQIATYEKDEIKFVVFVMNKN